MGLSRRRGDRFTVSIWPGFVDAMTALLLVLMFVLSIFMIVQFMLRDTITGQESELHQLAAEVAQLTQALGLERGRSADLGGQVGALTGSLATARAAADEQSGQIAALAADRAALEAALAGARTEIDDKAEAARLDAARREALEALVADLRRREAEAGTALAGQTAAAAELQRQLTEEEKGRLAEAAAVAALEEKLKGADTERMAMTLALEEQRKKAEETLTLLAAAQAAQQKAEAARAEQGAAVRDREALLAAARAELATVEGQTEEQQRQVALLNAQVADLRAQLGQLQGLLDASEGQTAASKVEIDTLGQRLNLALAEVAAKEKARAALEEAERKRLQADKVRLEAEARDLEKYRSEFFGRLRDILGGREGVRIEGDRFVFSSEVLFEPASATLSPEGKAQIAGVAAILQQIAGEIPADIDWVVRVDGHTDDTPLSGQGPYADNWELSQARALSVVRYLTRDLGFPPNRLSANGFGEYQPIDPSDTPEARARNRRIELKLTER